MTNLKINSTSTPYWCVVVEKNTFDFKVLPQMVEYWRGLKDKHEYWSTGEIKLPAGNWELLGCITSSGMDEGVREIVGKIHVEEMPSPYNDMSGGFHYDYIDYMNQGDYAGWQGEANSFRNPHPSALSLLTHNQITLTADTKAVVVKQIT